MLANEQVIVRACRALRVAPVVQREFRAVVLPCPSPSTPSACSPTSSAAGLLVAPSISDHHAAQLDRPAPKGRRSSFAARSSISTSGSSPPDPTSCSAPPSSSWPFEHPEAGAWLVAGTPAVKGRCARIRRPGRPRESAEERGAEDREKTGVPLGRNVLNPVNGEQIPIFVARLCADGVRDRCDHGGAGSR